MNSLLLSLFVSITASTASLGAVSNSNAPIKNVVNENAVTATSSIPEGGGEYGLDTTLKFNKTDPSDMTDYYYAVSFSPRLMTTIYGKKFGKSATFEEIKSTMLAEVLYDFDWKLIDDYSKPYNENLTNSYHSHIKYASDYIDVKNVVNPLSLWVCEKDDEGGLDYSTSFEVLSTFNYTPGITNFHILPDYFPMVGQKPITHYDEPSGQYSVDVAWYKDYQPMDPNENFTAKTEYSARFSINPKGKPMSPTFYGEFKFGLFVNDVYIDDETGQYALSDIYPIFSELKDTIVAKTSFDAKYETYNFSVLGKFNNAWKKTSYGGKGFLTFLYEGNDVATNYEEAQIISVDTINGTDVGSFNVKLDFKHLNDDKVLQVNYIIKNTSSNEKTFSLGSSTDIQIGSDDYAICYPFSDGSGFRMVSNKPADIDEKQNHAQLNFWCQNSKNVTDVDHFWYGAYNDDSEENCTEKYRETGNFLSYSSSEKKAAFTAEEVNRLSAYDKTRWQWEKDETTGLETPPRLDSAMAYSWTNKTLQPGEEKTLSVLFSIGGPGSEDEAAGDFTSIKTIDDTIFYSGSENFNVTKITVDSNVLDPSCYKVDNANKSVTFLENANLKPGVKVSVYINNKEIKVRNDILPKGPSIIRITLKGSDEPVELKEGNNKIFLNDDGSRSDTETNHFFEYNPITGKIKAQNALVENDITIPEDPTVTNGEITLNIAGENTINKIDSAYPVIVSGGSNDTLNTNNISANKLGVDGCKCTINAVNDEPCVSNVSDIVVNSGTLTLNSETIGVDINDKEELNLAGAGSLIINAKIGINAPNTNVIVSGKIDITSSECGIKCDTLTITDGCDLTINNPTGKSLDINKIAVPKGFEIIGGKIDAEGRFTPTEGATQLIIRKAAAVCFIHWILLALLVALIGFTLILWFVFKIKNFQNKENNKLNIAPIIGFSLHLVGVIISAVFMHCVACYVLLAINLAMLAGAIALYILYKEKNKDQLQDKQKENNEK